MACGCSGAYIFGDLLPACHTADWDTIYFTPYTAYLRDGGVAARHAEWTG